MAGAVAKVFGVLFLVLGILAAGAGLSTMLFVEADERDRQADESGLFGFLRQDEAREERNRAAGAGGVGLFTVGLLLVMLGLFLTALGFTQPAPSQRPGDPATESDDAEPDRSGESAEARAAQAWAVPAAVAFGSILMLLMLWYAVR